MKTQLLYRNNSQPHRSFYRLSGGNESEIPPFFLLPDRQMSFVKILELPPVSKNKLRDMLRFQIRKIYPGEYEEISFDFLSFRISNGWKIVLYVLKKQYMSEIFKMEECKGVVLPLQLYSRKELQSIKELRIEYPDMLEQWNFEDGIPSKVERYDLHITLPLTERQVSGCLLTTSDRMDSFCTGHNNISVRSFSEMLPAIRRSEIYFPEYRHAAPDRLTPALSLTALIISILLLVQVYSTRQKFERQQEGIHTQLESVRLEAALNQEKIDQIEQIEHELKNIRENSPPNVYEMLIRMREALSDTCRILSFSLKGNELTLTLRSINALQELSRLKEEFGNVRASNIRSMEDGNETFTAWVEIRN